MKTVTEKNSEYYLQNRVKRKPTKMLNKCRERAKYHGWEMTLTKDWLEQKIKAGFCELSGLPFDLSFDTEFTHNPNAPSIDRIDCNKGYTPENCRVVLWSLNHALSEYGLDYLIKVVNAIQKR